MLWANASIPDFSKRILHPIGIYMFFVLIKFKNFMKTQRNTDFKRKEQFWVWISYDFMNFQFQFSFIYIIIGFSALQISPWNWFHGKLNFILLKTNFTSFLWIKFFFCRVGNPHSGTVADTVVTLPERYDFFLVSQSVGQGTVNPTSYNVILDESGWAPDR